jgi:hypothetical protein
LSEISYFFFKYAWHFGAVNKQPLLFASCNKVDSTRSISWFFGSIRYFP